MRWLLFFMLVSLPISGQANERANASFYIDTFGRVDPQRNRFAGRAHAVFDQLKRVSSNDTATAELVIIDTDGKPWAIALADGNVVLSRGALEIIYGVNDFSQGDAWLAFVLGHELAHLGSRDLWQQHVFASLSAGAGSDQSGLSELQNAMSTSAFDLQSWRERELKADERGYLIAALAGFEVERIFAKDARHDFLQVWEAQTQSAGATHYGAKVRTEFLRLRLEAADQKIDQFQLGVMLAHFGRFKDALTIFEDFQVYFSSREVLLNLGYVHLQLAREAMPVTLAYRFWMPTLLESDSGVRVPSRSFSTGLSDKATKHLNDATRYLERALALDPDEPTVSTNLAIAYQYLGKFFRARAVIEEALVRVPSNANLLILRALIIVDQEPDIDMWPRAVSTLKAMDSGSSATSQDLLFNLARLHQERERFGAAQGYWQRLQDRTNIPATYRHQVCLALDVTCEIESILAGKDGIAMNSGELFQIHPGDVLQHKLVNNSMPEADLNYWQIQEISGVTIKAGRTVAYAIDGVVEIVRHFHESGGGNFNTAGLSIVGIGSIGTQRITRFEGGLSKVERNGSVTELWFSR